MNLEKANELVGTYKEHLNKEITVSRLANPAWQEIKTPFLLNNRDLISISVSEWGGCISLSDDGVVLNEMELAGIDTDDDSDKIINEILLGFGVKIDTVSDALNGTFNSQLLKTCTPETFPQAFHEFIQCILALDALSVVNRLK